LLLIGGTAAAWFSIWMFLGFVKNLGISVEDESVALVTRFGRLVEKLERPGLHMYVGRIWPWVKIHHVSKALDFRVIPDLHINDARGTTLLVTLWLEFRIEEPEKALFAVEDWEQALHNVLAHSAMATMGSKDFSKILDDRAELGAQLQRDVSQEAARWGVRVERVFLRHIALSAEVSQQVFETVAARLERARAVVLEQGRIDAAALDAKTAQSISLMVAEAKSQYPLAVGRALAKLSSSPQVLAAYTTLYELNQIQAPRTVSFRGFGSEVRSIEAAMISDSNLQGSVRSTD
jgi:regulator of protease activity HflC (stomatin/prohibitin superfamily)